MNDTLLAGTSHRDITPPAGKPMAAFPVSKDPMQPRIAEGAHDALWARALALGDAAATLVIAAADVVYFRWDDVDAMRAAFAEQTGLPGENLVICATHNHNGPECTYHFGGTRQDPYIGQLRDQVVAAAVEAQARMAPARVSAGVVQADLASNRRRIQPDGRFQGKSIYPERKSLFPVDPKVSVLRLDGEDGKPVAATLHFAAHPVINTTPNRLFTAGYPGAAVRRFQEDTGVAEALFLQGACGDTHPYQSRAESYEAVEEMGEDLAREAADAWRNAGAQSHLRIAVQRWRADVPHRYAAAHTVRIETTVVRLSPQLALVFWPGEPFVELSLALQWRSPFARTLVVGYALGAVGYVPPRNAYEFGGYGVDAYVRDAPESSRTSVPPGTGEMFVEKTADVLAALRKAPDQQHPTWRIQQAEDTT